MARTSGAGFGKELCEVLGLDPNTVSSIQLVCKPGQPVRVITVSYVPEEVAGKVKALVSRYQLVEVEK